MLLIRHVIKPLQNECFRGILESISGLYSEEIKDLIYSLPHNPGF